MTEANKVGSDKQQQSLQGISVIPEPTEQRLTQRQATDYEEHRLSFINWLITFGKNPQKAEGYAKETTRARSCRVDKFYRWVWENEGRYTTSVTHEHADDYMRELAYGDTSQDNKANHMKSLKTLFRWRSHKFGEEEWEPEITFSNDTSTTNPRDYLTVEERKKLREAALNYKSIPSYNAITPDERDRWKTHLAQRYKKPKSEVSPNDFDRANSWKYPSLIWTTLDAGLRPVEVKRSTVDWIDLQNNVLRIPMEESSKNEDNWIVSLTDRTTSALERWLTERQNYDKYADSDAIWLTRDGNPYQSYSLNYLLRGVCEEAKIDTEKRDLTWYSIRHSVGTYMTREEGLAAAQAQLRHKSPETTLRYDQTPAEDRRDALNNIG
jgi:site-specific recombinase XerD